MRRSSTASVIRHHVKNEEGGRKKQHAEFSRITHKHKIDTIEK